MPRLNKVLWSMVILFIAISTIIFSFGIILVGVVMVSLYGVYRHYFPKKKANKYHAKSQVYTFGEVIDLKPEVIHRTIEVKKINK